MDSQFVEKELKAGGRLVIETLYNGIHIFMDKETGYYYADSMCKDNGKRFVDYMKTQDYNLMISTISSTCRILQVDLIFVFQGMPNDFRGRWIHPLLVHTVCEWANKKYAVLVSMLMNEKAKQALIEKKTLQEQVDDERARTKRLQQELNDEKDAHENTRIDFDLFRAEADARHKELMTSLQAAAEREEKLLDDCKCKDKKIGKLKTTVLQQLGLTEEIREQNDDLLMLSTAHRNDLQRTTNKINGLAQVVNGLSAANYDRDRDCVFIWKLYLSETAPEPSYKKEIPVNAIWLYSAIREDGRVKLPEDAEIVFEANVVNRSIYKALLEELRDECIDHHFRHILIAEENAVNFINSLQQRLEARSIHPETVDVGPIVNLIESRNTEREIAARKAARTAHVVGVRQAIIDEGKLYIKVYSRYQRIYNLDENHELIRELNANRFFYIKRKGKAERLTTATLEQSRFRSYGID